MPILGEARPHKNPCVLLGELCAKQNAPQPKTPTPPGETPEANATARAIATIRCRGNPPAQRLPLRSITQVQTQVCIEMLSDPASKSSTPVPTGCGFRYSVNPNQHSGARVPRSDPSADLASNFVHRPTSESYIAPHKHQTTATSPAVAQNSRICSHFPYQANHESEDGGRWSPTRIRTNVKTDLHLGRAAKSQSQVMAWHRAP